MTSHPGSAKRTGLWLILLMTALAATACGDDPADLPPGHISLSWMVGTGGCAASGVTTVIVYLTGEDRATTLHDFDCTDGEIGTGSGVTIRDLRPGTYDMVLRGRDAQGFDRFGDSASGVVVRSEGTATLGTLRLAALHATIHVSWYFDNGRLCDTNDVATVEATLFDNEYVEQAESTACSQGSMDLTSVEAGEYLVDLVGRDAEGRLRFNGQDNVTVDKGDFADADIELQRVGDVTPVD